MEMLQSLLATFAPYTPFVAFVAGFLTEDLLLFFAFLAGTGDLSIIAASIFGLLGILAHDAFVYWCAYSSLATKIFERWKPKERYRGIATFLKKLGRGHYFFPLVLSKFVYGTRTALVVYAARSEHSTVRFFAFNALAAAIWIAVMMPLGWLAGRGVSVLAFIVRDIEKVLGIIVLAMVVVYLANLTIRRWITRRRAELKRVARRLQREAS